MRSQSLLETLERRQLMATINVTNFGAIPGDGLSDTAALQAAIKASAAGDTIYFSRGVFDLPA
ncbi:MAG TPA: glycosyl hydrolase family 28-related protein, partial [Tepidisphaeraceae bacterium]